MAHAFGTSDYMFAWSDAEVGGEKTHGCACCHDIYYWWHFLECADHHIGIIAVG